MISVSNKFSRGVRGRKEKWGNPPSRGSLLLMLDLAYRLHSKDQKDPTGSIFPKVG